MSLSSYKPRQLVFYAGNKDGKEHFLTLSGIVLYFNWLDDQTIGVYLTEETRSYVALTWIDGDLVILKTSKSLEEVLKAIEEKYIPRLKLEYSKMTAIERIKRGCIRTLIEMGCQEEYVKMRDIEISTIR